MTVSCVETPTRFKVQIAWKDGDTWKQFTDEDVNMFMLQDAIPVLSMFDRFAPVALKFGSHILTQKAYLHEFKGKVASFDKMLSKAKFGMKFNELFT